MIKYNTLDSWSVTGDGHVQRRTLITVGFHFNTSVWQSLYHMPPLKTELF